MRKHRFYVTFTLQVSQTLDLPEDVSHQISRVLRLDLNQEIYLFNDSSYEYTALITNITKKNVSVQVQNAHADQATSPLQIHLAQVIGKGDKMDWVIQKATELGVHSITPIYSENSVVKNIADRTGSKIAHWQKVAVAACCQCWRNNVPIINSPENYMQWLQQANTDSKIILAPNPNASSLSTVKITDRVTILIGPEGGLSDAEISAAIAQGFVAVNLGPRILRTETAGLAAIAILQALHGDLQ